MKISYPLHLIDGILQPQGSQIRQIWRILRQNCLDDSTEVTEGVTSTPEIFRNKNSFVLTFFATNTIYVNCKRCIKTLIKSSKLKNYTARQNRRRVNYDQSLLDDRHHGFEPPRSADCHRYLMYPSRQCIHARNTCWKV